VSVGLVVGLGVAAIEGSGVGGFDLFSVGEELGGFDGFGVVGGWLELAGVWVGGGVIGLVGDSVDHESESSTMSSGSESPSSHSLLTKSIVLPESVEILKVAKEESLEGPSPRAKVSEVVIACETSTSCLRVAFGSGTKLFIAKVPARNHPPSFIPSFQVTEASFQSPARGSISTLTWPWSLLASPFDTECKISVAFPVE